MGTEYYSIGDCAERVGLSGESIRRSCISGEIKAFKLGKQWFIHRGPFDEKVSLKTEEPAAA